MRAWNEVGPGPWTPPCRATLRPRPPGPPRGVAAHAAGPGTVLVTWAPPAADNGAPVAGYEVRYAAAGRPCAAQVRGAVRGHAIGALRGGQRVEGIVVLALNDRGPSRPSAPPVACTTPHDPPETPPPPPLPPLPPSPGPPRPPAVGPPGG